MMSKIEEQLYTLKNPAMAAHVFGEQDKFLKIVTQRFKVEAFPTGTQCKFLFSDQSIEGAVSALEHIEYAVSRGLHLKPYEVDHLCKTILKAPQADLRFLYSNPLIQNCKNEAVLPKTLHQYELTESIRNKDVTFGWGPAGTGKTYLAVCMAVSMLLKKEVQRIVLTRPAVEAGEKLGFLPGDLESKINPFLRPLLDSIKDLIDVEKVALLIEKGVIEIAPLAYMRGRTLNNAFIILDEAQNTSPAQMKMFLTRLGYGSKAVITGDITQIDLPTGQTSGLIHAIHVLRHLKEVEFIEFDSSDVVRHSLVQKIIDAYDRKS